VSKRRGPRSVHSDGSGDAGRVPSAAAMRLLEAAFDLFEKKGFDNTTVDEIAHRCGMSKSTIYLHFRGKEDILVTGIQPLIDLLAGVLDAPEAGRGNYASRLEFVMRSYVHLGLSNRKEASVLALLGPETPVGILTRRRRSEIERSVADLILGGIEVGEFRGDLDPLLTARLLLSLSNWVTVWYQRNGVLAPEAIAQAVASLGLDGLTRS